MPSARLCCGLCNRNRVLSALMIEQGTDMSTTPKKSFSFGRSLRTIHLLHSFDVLDEFHSLLHPLQVRARNTFVNSMKD